MVTRQWTVLLMVLLWSLLASPTIAGSAGADSTAIADEESWLARNLHRFFGSPDQQADGTQGLALDISDAYQQHAGLLIEVVLVHQVPRFDEGWDQGKNTSQRFFNEMTSSFQSYTKESVIRDYLLFQQGDRLDPYALADSEVLLRNLPYINDVRILIFPLQGETESVAVLVETTDRWPFGLNGKLVTAEQYSADLYSENLGGTGIRFSNEFLHKSSGDPTWGYRGILSKDNIEGTFLAAGATYEDSYRRNSRGFGIDRQLAHPDLRFVGGLAHERTKDLEKEGPLSTYGYTDFWVGDVLPLYDSGRRGGQARPILVPAVRYYRLDYLQRPSVAPDSNRSFHDRQTVLVGLAFQRYRQYKTSHLFGDGETEGLPIGLAIKLSSGYESSEFQDRTPIFLEFGMTSIRNRGDVALANLEVGGFLRNRRMEEGLLKLSSGYMTPLMGREGLHYRFYTFLEYTLGLRRHPEDEIFLDETSGIRDLAEGKVSGNQRLAGTLESRLFTDWALLGFRFSFFGFTDAGMVGAQNSSSIFQEKIYVSAGLGVRLRNPGLVLPTVQMQFSFLTNVDSPGMAVKFKVGNVPGRTIKFPGTKPGILGYD